MSPEEFVELHCAPDMLAKAPVVEQISLSSINPEFRQQLLQDVFRIRKNIQSEIKLYQYRIDHPLGEAELTGFQEVNLSVETLISFLTPDDQRMLRCLTMAENLSERLSNAMDGPMIYRYVSQVWELQVSQLSLNRKSQIWGGLERELICKQQEKTTEAPEVRNDSQSVAPSHPSGTPADSDHPHARILDCLSDSNRKCVEHLLECRNRTAFLSTFCNPPFANDHRDSASAKRAFERIGEQWRRRDILDWEISMRRSGNDYRITLNNWPGTTTDKPTDK